MCGVSWLNFNLSRELQPRKLIIHIHISPPYKTYLVSPSMPKPSFIVFGGGSLNYRDLDLEVNGEGNTSYEQGRVWGVPYFGNNFDRLVRVKSWVDPGNFFTNEQYLKA